MKLPLEVRLEPFLLLWKLNQDFLKRARLHIEALESGNIAVVIDNGVLKEDTEALTLEEWKEEERTALVTDKWLEEKIAKIRKEG